MENGWRAALRPLIALVATVCALGLGEAALQVGYRVTHGAWLAESTDAFAVHYAMPVDDERAYSLRPGYRDPDVAINREGFRGPVVDPCAPVVAVVGDSVPFGLGIGPGVAYPDRLAGRLREAGVAAAVLNAGVPSYNLRQSFARYWKEIDGRYDVRALVVDAANDVSLLSWFGDDWTPSTTWRDLYRSQHWTGPADLLVSAHLLENAWQRARPPARSHQARAPERLLASLEDLLDLELARLAARDVSVVLLPVNPLPYQTENVEGNESLPPLASYVAYQEAWGETVDRLNELLERIAGERSGVSFLDIRRPMDRGDRSAFFVDFIHLSPSGHDLVAEQLADFLLEPGIAERLQAPSSRDCQSAAQSP